MLYLSTYPRKKGFCLPGKRKFLLLFVIPFIILLLKRGDTNAGAFVKGEGICSASRAGGGISLA